MGQLLSVRYRTMPMSRLSSLILLHKQYRSILRMVSMLLMYEARLIRLEYSAGTRMNCVSERSLYCVHLPRST
jgi:hypothetical protein